MTDILPILNKAIFPPQLNDEESTFLAKAEQIFNDELIPLAKENDELGRYPTKSIAILRKTGVFHAAVPKELGGLGYSHAFSLECQLRLAMVDGAVAQLFKVHDELTREIFQYCPDAQKKRLANYLLEQNHVLGLAVAEAGKSAIDPMKTSVSRNTQGDYVINGFKIYTTAAAEADHIATWAFNADLVTEDNPLSGMQLFLVPKDSPGVTVNRDWNALGQRATDSGSIAFENVVCKEDQIASVSGKAPLIHSSVRYQAGFSAILVGLGFGAIKAALPYIKTKSRPWAATGIHDTSEDPYIKHTLGRITAALNAAYVLVQRCGPLLDSFERGEIDRSSLALPISSTKVAANEAALDATQTIFSMMGAGAVRKEFNFDYWWRNARTLSLHDPVDWKIHEIGRHVLTGWEPEPGVYQ